MPATMYIGDALEVMNRLPENSVDLVLTSPPFLALRSYLPADHPDKAKEGGSQATPGEFIDWLIDIAEACDRVLAPHGSLAVELGDTYAGSGGAGGDYDEGKRREGQQRADGSARRNNKFGLDEVENRKVYTVDKGSHGWPLSKSLSLIPELFRLSLVYGFNPLTGRTTERWRLRNVVRWVRPNPPVGALGDKFRPATSELMVFCKSAKRYFDLDAVREPFSDQTKQSAVVNTDGAQARAEQGGLRRVGPQINTHAGAPPLDWWKIPPGGYKGAHYAVFPPALCEKPIKAMSPERVCKVCGEPSRRISENSYTLRGEPFESPKAWNGERLTQNAIGVRKGDILTHTKTTGWTDCGHDSYRPGLVLDPFGGSGTVAQVATGYGRDCILIDLDERNYALAEERVGPIMITRGTLK